MSDTRISRAQAVLVQHNLDALLVTSPENRRYMSGFTGSDGTLLLTQSQAWVIVDFRYIDQARQQCMGFEAVQSQTLLPTLAELLQNNGVHRIGFEEHAVTYAEAMALHNLGKDVAGLEWLRTNELLEHLRLVKDDTEVAAIRRAAAIADDAFAHILNVMRPGVLEIEVALELETYMRRQGASGAAFDTIVASGWRGARPHGVASDKPLAAGELVTLDFGAVVDGYASDITRTVAIGQPSDRQREVYNAVLESQLRAIDALHVGMTGKEADAVARSFLSDHGLGPAFGHSLGHGLGLQVHEGPRLSKDSNDTLSAGMVVTVEPGAYLTDWGGVRIEDDVWVRETGVEVLTQAPKHDLICL